MADLAARPVRIRAAVVPVGGEVSMKMLWFAALAIGTALRLGAAAAAPFKTEGGLVQGLADDNLMVYKGIPFAAPPVGVLRWRAPQPAPKWEGVRQADQFAPGCMQSMGGPPPGGVSEDCLHLNVWTQIG